MRNLARDQVQSKLGLSKTQIGFGNTARMSMNAVNSRNAIGGTMLPAVQTQLERDGAGGASTSGAFVSQRNTLYPSSNIARQSNNQGGSTLFGAMNNNIDFQTNQTLNNISNIQDTSNSRIEGDVFRSASAMNLHNKLDVSGIAESYAYQGNNSKHLQ